MLVYRYVRSVLSRHPFSYPMGTRGSFCGSKAAGAWSWPLTSIYCRGQIMSGAIPPLPNTPSWSGAQLKHRDFTFTFTSVFMVLCLVKHRYNFTLLYPGSHDYIHLDVAPLDPPPPPPSKEKDHVGGTERKQVTAETNKRVYAWLVQILILVFLVMDSENFCNAEKEREREVWSFLCRLLEREVAQSCTR
jgi:hypothetical protein